MLKERRLPSQFQKCDLSWISNYKREAGENGFSVSMDAEAPCVSSVALVASVLARIQGASFSCARAHHCYRNVLWAIHRLYQTKLSNRTSRRETMTWMVRIAANRSDELAVTRATDSAVTAHKAGTLSSYVAGSPQTLCKVLVVS